MQVTTQFGLKKSLDRLIQLVYLSSNFFSEIDVQHQVCSFDIDKEKYTEDECKQLLTYFLDLIESLSLERIYLTQDPNNKYRFFYNGGF
ncbi:MAG: hypothetical protein ACXACP_11385 [Candidatus Hodarchaeales archaeon]|jgi:hypothetical protein